MVANGNSNYKRPTSPSFPPPLPPSSSPASVSAPASPAPPLRIRPPSAANDTTAEGRKLQQTRSEQQLHLQRKTMPATNGVAKSNDVTATQRQSPPIDYYTPQPSPPPVPERNSLRRHTTAVDCDVSADEVTLS